jgi:hypothetical protein
VIAEEAHPAGWALCVQYFMFSMVSAGSSFAGLNSDLLQSESGSGITLAQNEFDEG